MNIFDFDGTLYRGDSTFDFWKYCLRHYSTTWGKLPNALFPGFAYLTKSISLEEFKGKFYTFFSEIPNIDDAVLRFWEINIDKLRIDVLSYAEDGDLVVSASPEFLLKPICNELHFRLIASKVDSQSGKLLSRNCKGEEKVDRIKEAGFPLEYEKVFSDSLSDTPIAKLAKEAFLVTRSGLEPFPIKES